MAPSSEILAVTRYDIQNRLIDFFSEEFERPRSEITWDLDLKVYFNYSNIAWATLTGTLNSEKWMTAIDVKLTEAQMLANTTVEKLTYLIWNKIPKLVIPSIQTSSFEKRYINFENVKAASAKRKSDKSSKVARRKKKGKKSKAKTR